MYQLFDDGKINAVQSAFWQPHPEEELFDLESDPHETVNLANSAPHEEILQQLRASLAKHQNQTRDLSFIPEPIIRKAVLAGESPAEAFAAYFEPNSNREIFPKYPISEYWKFSNLLSADLRKIQTSMLEAIDAIDHPEPCVAVMAAEVVFIHCEDRSVRQKALEALVSYARYPENELILSLQAGVALDHAHEAGIALPESVNQLIADHDSIPGWAKSYRPRLLERFQKKIPTT